MFLIGQIDCMFSMLTMQSSFIQLGQTILETQFVYLLNKLCRIVDPLVCFQKQLSLIWTSSWSKPGSNMLAYIDPSARHSIQPLEQTTCKNIGMHVKVACCLLLYCKSWFFMQYQILKNLYASQIKTTNVNARLKNPLIFVTCKRLMHSHMVLIDRRPLQP